MPAVGRNGLALRAVLSTIELSTIELSTDLRLYGLCRKRPGEFSQLRARRPKSQMADTRYRTGDRVVAMSTRELATERGVGSCNRRIGRSRLG